MTKLSFSIYRLACCLVLPALLAAGSWTAGPAQADQTIKAKASVILSGPPPTILPAGDDPGHLVGMGSWTGKAVFDDGRRADYRNVFFLDLVRGVSAASRGYSKMTFTDGSWLFVKWRSRMVGRDKYGFPKSAGDGEIIKGGGKYQGIKGTVTFTTRRLPRSKELPTGGNRASADFTYTLP